VTEGLKVVEVAIPAETCRNCRYQFTPKGEGSICRRLPPRPFIFPQAQSSLLTRGEQQQVALRPISIWPPINLEWTCGEWRSVHRDV
jgi:hypothetical protein